MIYLNNAFSLGMLTHLSGNLRIARVDAQDVPEGAVSQVGHADAAKLFTELLGRPVAFNRVSGVLEHGDVIYVGQYKGPRLAEGATTLPPGAWINWVRVEIDNPPAVGAFEEMQATETISTGASGTVEVAPDGAVTGP